MKTTTANPRLAGSHSGTDDAYYYSHCGAWCIHQLTKVRDGSIISLGCARDMKRVRYGQECRHKVELLSNDKRRAPRHKY